MLDPFFSIAGGSRGIGAATARLAAERGYDVAVNYVRNADAAAEVADGGEDDPAARPSRCKATWPRKPTSCACSTRRRQGARADHAFRPQRRHRRQEFAARRASAATIRDVLDVNLFGCLICAREAVRRMSTAHGGKGGSIVMLSSMAAVTGGASEYVLYAAAKGGVDAITNGLAREVAKEGMRINAIRPGPTEPKSTTGTAGADHADNADGPAGRAGRDRGSNPVSPVGRGVLRQRHGVQRLRRPLTGAAGPALCSTLLRL